MFPAWFYIKTMKNTHLEHPEDCLLTSREDFMEMLRFLRCIDNTVSVKYDGAPAIVWGINPENNRFFVGTKSVFNKVKIKINYTHADIERNHGDKPRVASILHICMDSLPRLNGIYQGDFIGYGGDCEYTPNCITYKFPDIISPESIVFAAHTHYVGSTTRMQRFASVSPGMCLLPKYMQTDRRVNHSVKIECGSLTQTSPFLPVIVESTT